MLSDLLRGCEPDIAPETFEIIGRILKARSGFCLGGYKDQCVKRRINIRVRATESPSAEAYSDLLTESASEQENLLRVLTIHVSHFFRNPSTFEKLSSEILPQLLDGRGAAPVRIASLGCAAGEEPYSLALILRERFTAALSAGRFSMLASDVDRTILERAREGRYHQDRLAEVPADLLSRWFAREGQHHRLAEEIRSLVVFQHADLNEPGSCPPSDLILCRNVLIYFERGRQEAILNAFADALGKGGFLVLGKSETLFGSARRRFQTVCPMERIYRAV